MLDADDALLEQAMQTGAALKRARDNQKAARKPKVSQECVGFGGHDVHWLLCVKLSPPQCNMFPCSVCCLTSQAQ